MNTFFIKNSSGFVLLFSIVVSSIIFFIGIGVYSIATKELAMSELTENSQRSIFIADAGLECGTRYYFPILNQNQTPIECFDQSVNVNLESATRASFWLYFEGSDTDYRYNSCAKVTMEKEGEQYTIFSQGFNACERNGSSDPELLTNYRGFTERVYRISL